MSKSEGSKSEQYSADVSDTLLGVHLREDSDSEGFSTDVSDAWMKRMRQRRRGNQVEA